MQNVKNRERLEFIKKYKNEKTIKQQSKLTFNGIHKSYEICDSYYTFKQNEVLTDKPVYSGFPKLELSKLLRLQLYCDILQPYFGEKKLHLLYMDTDIFVLTVNTHAIIKNLQNLDDLFDFSNLRENHELYST